MVYLVFETNDRLLFIVLVHNHYFESDNKVLVKLKFQFHQMSNFGIRNLFITVKCSAFLA